jgi:hypothetical protein
MVGDDQAAVATRTAATEAAFLDHGDLPAFIQQKIGNKSADNTTTDDDNLILFHAYLV